MDFFIVGTNGADLIIPGNNSASNDLLAGDDTIIGLQGDDTLDGGKGDDLINGNQDNDRLIGDVGNDTIDGGSDNDLIYGDYVSFNSTLSDGLLLTSMGRTSGATIWRIRNGFDTSQNVTLKAYDGTIIYSGKVAANTNFYIASSVIAGSATHILLDGLGNQVGVKAAGTQSLSSFDDNLNGGNNNDTIYGGLGDDTINGGAGQDLLYGDDGNDVLTGGNNNDTLVGGFGDDILVGGNNNDIFVFAQGDGTDIVNDFRAVGAGTDLIGLSGGLTFGQLSFSLNDILVGTEVLATLTGFNTTTLTAADFVTI
ncbi:hypothetical protein C7H19_16215 [Aphanothece hegewaldii CCALA 016]|uniref:Calcium-binding protein n=1 Tax=Aphanothece hegewaldii CCALA 016 TaxID=2107694 RepID=A0A2T1LV49_9CHRO|nr:calcium-binding protein [Aphanothece hegewaldii]PSF35554.1 hypothetical protein C7H19_16215 [Aphanothece hegewaldii CCALA 016]